jgi:hypothetical protein
MADLRRTRQEIDYLITAYEQINPQEGGEKR